jgi:hypothetical protein
VPDADLTQLAHVEFLERFTNCCCGLLAVAEYTRQYVLKLVIGGASSARRGLYIMQRSSSSLINLIMFWTKTISAHTAVGSVSVVYGDVSELRTALPDPASAGLSRREAGSYGCVT